MTAEPGQGQSKNEEALAQLLFAHNLAPWSRRGFAMNRVSARPQVQMVWPGKWDPAWKKEMRKELEKKTFSGDQSTGIFGTGRAAKWAPSWKKNLVGALYNPPSATATTATATAATATATATDTAKSGE
jgi:hypothetical protein